MYYRGDPVAVAFAELPQPGPNAVLRNHVQVDAVDVGWRVRLPRAIESYLVVSLVEPAHQRGPDQSAAPGYNHDFTLVGHD